MLRRQILAGVMLTAAAVALNGCRVEANKNGGSDNVKVATPFGGLQVKTDESVKEGVGLPVYPGAEQVKKSGDDNGAADVNLSFGRFQLRVKALSYRSGDDPEKLKAFYRKALGRYGDVIECAGNRPVGQPTRTAEGLTCEEGSDKHGTGHGLGQGLGHGSGGASGDEVTGEVQMKAGSEHHQHVVGLEREGAGTKFGLVALDLPGGLPGGDGDSEAKQ